MFTPKISIITVVYNGEKTILKTIKSIEAQTYNNIEYIVIDGNSKDKTIDIIKNNSSTIDKFISEPDDGLYYAMNKGLDLATGDYVLFINSGDELADKDVLKNIFSDKKAYDIYYGNTMIVNENGEEIGKRRLKPPKKLTWKSFKKGMVVSHQSIIIKRELTKNYDTNFNFSADFDWVLYALKNSNSIKNCYIYISKFLDGGLTKQNIIPGLKERYKIMKNYYGSISTLYNHFILAFKLMFYYVKHKRF